MNFEEYKQEIEKALSFSDANEGADYYGELKKRFDGDIQKQFDYSRRLDKPLQKKLIKRFLAIIRARAREREKCKCKCECKKCK